MSEPIGTTAFNVEWLDLALAQNIARQRGTVVQIDPDYRPEPLYLVKLSGAPIFPGEEHTVWFDAAHLLTEAEGDAAFRRACDEYQAWRLEHNLGSVTSERPVRELGRAA